MWKLEWLPINLEESYSLIQLVRLGNSDLGGSQPVGAQPPCGLPHLCFPIASSNQLVVNRARCVGADSVDPGHGSGVVAVTAIESCCGWTWFAMCWKLNPLCGVLGVGRTLRGRA